MIRVIMKGSVNIAKRTVANTVPSIKENSQITAFLAFGSENKDRLHNLCFLRTRGYDC